MIHISLTCIYNRDYTFRINAEEEMKKELDRLKLLEVSLFNKDSKEAIARKDYLEKLKASCQVNPAVDKVLLYYKREGRK